MIRNIANQLGKRGIEDIDGTIPRGSKLNQQNKVCDEHAKHLQKNI